MSLLILKNVSNRTIQSGIGGICRNVNICKEVSYSTDAGTSRLHSAPPGTSTAITPPNPGIIEFKTGLIEKVDLHPNADSLYVSKVSINHSTPLTVCSGLVKHLSKDQLEGRKIVVVTNLKPSKLRGITSEAMLLAAVGNDNQGNTKLELVIPPTHSEIGEGLYFDNYLLENKKTVKPKVWQGIQKHLFVNESKQVIFRDSDGDKVLRNEKGDIASVESLDNGIVS